MKKLVWGGMLLLGCLVTERAAAQEQVAAEGLKVEGRVAFTEGPAWHAPTGNVYFSEIENNRIVRRDPTGALHNYRIPAGRANGLAFDPQGRLVACEGHREGGNRRVTRTELDGRIVVLTDQFGGKPYNSPNDLAIDSRGRVYFTDPRYGSRDDMHILDAEGKPVEGVYRIDPDGSVVRVLTHEVDRPNGICLSADERWIFVADNNNDAPGKNRKLWRFPLAEDGSVDGDRGEVLFDWGNGRGPDGICFGPDGDVYAAAGTNFRSGTETSKHRSGIYVIDAEAGGLKRFLPVPEDMITNCTFGDDDGRTLYITAGHKLWSLRIDR